MINAFLESYNNLIDFKDKGLQHRRANCSRLPSTIDQYFNSVHYAESFRLYVTRLSMTQRYI